MCDSVQRVVFDGYGRHGKRGWGGKGSEKE